MKKIIISLAFLFTLFIINSCTKDDTIAPPVENTPKISKWNIKVTDEGEISNVLFDIQYKDNNISIIDVNINNEKSKLIYFYENGKVKNIKQNLLDGSEKLDINFIYENDKLVELNKFSEGKQIQNTIYTYSGNNLTKVVSAKVVSLINNNNISVEYDTTTFTNFINGRPTEENYIRVYADGVMGSKYTKVYKYENGNLLETFNKSDGELTLELIYEYNLNKENIFEQFYFIRSMLSNFRFDYIPGNYDKNLITKEASVSLRCDFNVFDKPTEQSSTNFSYSFNNLGNVTKAVTSYEIFCEEYPYKDLNGGYEFLLEW